MCDGLGKYLENTNDLTKIVYAVQQRFRSGSAYDSCAKKLQIT
jgi:hypothetical protein